MLVLQILRPGIVNERWIANTIKFAIPLAILAGCQTMTMLTGGIDLSVGTVATMAPSSWRRRSSDVPAVAIADRAGAGRADRPGQRHRRRRLPRASADHDARHQPDRHRLPAGLPAHGHLPAAPVPPELAWLGGRSLLGFLPNACCCSCRWPALIIFTLRRTGFGRLLYAVGDNEKAARLSGVRYWQVLVALYVISGMLAGITGLLYVGLIKATVALVDASLLPSVAAAVIGGTSIFGGRGGYAGTIVGALILTVLTTLLTVLRMPEGFARSCSGPSSSPSRPPTRGSPRSPDQLQWL